jgi:serine acetyltransferase
MSHQEPISGAPAGLCAAFCADVRFCRARRKAHPSRVRALLWFASSGLLVLATQRCNFAMVRRKMAHGWDPAAIALRLLVAVGRLLSLMVAKSDVLGETPIAPGVCLADGGEMIIGAARIGTGTVINSQVTIGVSAFQQARPSIGERVWVGSDSVIYGDITIGDGATIIPGSVVSMNVPERAVAGGNPALLVARDFDNSSLLESPTATIDAALLRPA